MTHKESNRRLEVLAAKLDTVDRNRFDYCVWVDSDWKGAPDLSCGTSACALGWACTIPEFRELGLHLSGEDYYDRSLIYDGVPEIDGWRGNDAARVLFGLSDSQAAYLFHARSDAEADYTAQQVAAKIRKFVKTRSFD